MTARDLASAEALARDAAGGDHRRAEPVRDRLGIPDQVAARRQFGDDAEAGRFGQLQLAGEFRQAEPAARVRGEEVEQPHDSLGGRGAPGH